MGEYGLRAKDGRDIVIVMIVLGVVSITSVVLRVISRRMRDLRLGLEDYMMIVAMCLVVASTIVVITTVTRGGVGLHMTEVHFADVEYVLKMIIPCQVLYGVGLGLVKTSMMILYLKLFGTKSSLRVAIYVTGAIVWAWALSIVLESFLICTPVELNWNPTLPGGKCGNRNAAFVVAGVLNMITDLMVMILPLPYSWGLQLPLGRKVGLSAAFCLGLFVSAISMLRVVSLMNIDFNDATYTLPIPLMWSIVEEQLAVVAANIPLLRRVFTHILPDGWLGASERKSYPSKGVEERNGRHADFALTRMDLGVNQSEIVSGRAGAGAGVSDDGRSDKELVGNGALPDGILMWRDYRISKS